MDVMDRIKAEPAGLGEIATRPMFGGYGMFWGEVCFGILFRDRPYLKVGERSNADYQAQGMGPFRPSERRTLNSYFRGAARGARPPRGHGLLGRGGDPCGPGFA